MNLKQCLLSTAVSAVSFGLLLSSQTFACTSINWKTENYGVIVSRTVDWFESSESEIEVRAKGQTYQGASTENAVTWTSKYSTLMFGLYNLGAVEGLNDAGLSASALFLDEESVGKEKSDQQVIENGRVVPFVLDNFATVAEALDALVNLSLVQAEHNGFPLRGHYKLQDTLGDSAILEYIDGKWNIYHGSQHNIMTNSPDYPIHQSNWAEIKPTSQTDYSADYSIPGNIRSDNRFIQASYMFEQLKEPTSEINAIAKLDSVLPMIPIDAANRELGGHMTTYATEWKVTYSLDTQMAYVRYQYGDVFTQYNFDFSELNDGKNYTLLVADQSLFGDVTDKFSKADGMMAQYKLNIGN